MHQRERNGIEFTGIRNREGKGRQSRPRLDVNGASKGRYSAVKREGTLTPATTQVDLGDMALREIIQSQKDKHAMIPVTRGPWSRQSRRDKK